MKIVGIFVNEVTNEGIHCIHYDNEELNEWDRLLSLWRDDTAYVTNYCADNTSYFSSPYYVNDSIQKIINRIRKEAEQLEDYIYNLTAESFTYEKTTQLQTIFKPLHNKEISLPLLQTTKFRYEDSFNFPRPMLRIYALRVAENTFIITGGAIKLTHLMVEHEDTLRELEKINSVRDYLLSNGIKDDENLIYYYEQ